MSLAVVSLPSIAEVLRGDRATRPLADRASAASLRRSLEEELAPTAKSAKPVVVTPRSHKTHSANVSAHARLRGTLIDQLVALHVAGHRVDDAFEDAAEAWVADAHGELRDAFVNLDPEERAQLATDVVAHGVVLARRLGFLQYGWRPRTSVTAVQQLLSGAVTVRDRFDVVVGSINTVHASVALLDVTTSLLDDETARTLAFHAVVQTLVAGVVPLRVVGFSTASGEVLAHEVDTDFLDFGRSVVIDTARQTVGAQ